MEAATTDLYLKEVPTEETITSNAIPLTVVVGLGGSGVMTVARQVARFSKAQTVLVPVAMVGDQGSALEASLQNLSCQLRAVRGEKVVLAVVGSISLPSLCAYLHQQHGKELRLQSVSVCVSLQHLLQEEGEECKQMGEEGWHVNWLQGLWDQMMEGFCNNVVITDLPSGGGGGQALTLLKEWLRYTNPIAQLLQCSPTFIDPQVLPEIVSSQAFLLPTSESRRQSQYPYWRALNVQRIESSRWGGGVSPGDGIDCERVVVLESSAPQVDLPRLLRVAGVLFPGANLPTLEEATSTTGSTPSPTTTTEASSKTGIRRAAELAKGKVEASQLVADSMKDFEEGLAALHSSGILGGGRVGAVQAMAGMVVVGKKGYVVEGSRTRVTVVEARAEVVNGGGVQVMGSKLSYQSLSALLELSRPYTKRVRPLRSRASLTQLEIAKVLEEAKTRPAPDGWWYDGKNYVDFFGNSVTTRPDAEDLINEYLAKQNENIQQSNVSQGLV